VHFIPTSSSWPDLVEWWFREITDKRIRRGVFQNFEQLIAAIRAFLESATTTSSRRVDNQGREHPRESPPSQGRLG
jgi:hypothetical protein